MTTTYGRAAQTYLHAGPLISLSDWSRAIGTILQIYVKFDILWKAKIEKNSILYVF